MHSPEPWTPFGIRVTDADQWIIAQCRNEANAQRITACVNACHGLPDMNGILTMVGDMKAAILTNDPELLEIVRKRLAELSTSQPPSPGQSTTTFPRPSHSNVPGSTCHPSRNDGKQLAGTRPFTTAPESRIGMYGIRHGITGISGC